MPCGDVSAVDRTEPSECGEAVPTSNSAVLCASAVGIVDLL